MTSGKDLAFPVFDKEGRCYYSGLGLTKREYFAAMAMQGYLANNKSIVELTPKGEPFLADEKMKYCVGIADALINALNKE